MKQTGSIFLIIGLALGVGNVAFAQDVGEFEKAPKTEYINSADSLNFAPVVFVIEPGFGHLSSYDYSAILVETMPSLSANCFYLKVKKPKYINPDVDRKWVWWNSIITNS